MPGTDADVIDALVGITPGSPLDAIRARRPEARAHAQATYRALFTPDKPGTVSAQERFAVGAFVAGLHGATAIANAYAARLTETGASSALVKALDATVAEATTRGPYGQYPAGPLTRENTAGPSYRMGAAGRAALGPRLTAAFEHVHMLVFHPRDAAPPALQALLDAGWSTTDIVTLSQIVAFLSFQIRVVTGLRTLAGRP
ncbi:MAG TPA: CMD domain protein [Methylomirabilota bacterium]|jgi:CMD domain protein|nr:CMD domain protein [Methylomirabilota bacterium]